MIIRNGVAGVVNEKVTEDMLVGYLESFQEKPSTTITFKRKIDEDDDLDADLEGL